MTPDLSAPPPPAFAPAPLPPGAAPRTCRICGTHAAAAAFRAREMMFGSGEVFDYFLCPACGCLQITEIPADLARHYGAGYYAYAERPARRGWRGALARARNRHLAGRRDPIGWAVAKSRPYPALAALRPLGLAHDARILDVGCGSGELLLALRSAGFKRLLGVDPFVGGDLDLGGGLRVVRTGLAALDGGSHDVVMFHHSLEHIADQHGTLAAARARLAPGGVCLVRIPTVSSWAWRTYGVDWCGLDAPRHLFLHSVKSIRWLGERHGLAVERVVSDSTAFQFWGSEQYRRGLALMPPGSRAIAPAAGVFRPAELRRFARRAAALNRAGDGDQIVVTFRRPR